MQNRFVVLKGVSFVDNLWKPTGVHTYSTSYPDTHKNYFFVLHPGTYSGDRKSPYPIEFQRSLISHYDGRQIIETANEYNVQTGPISNTLSALSPGYDANAYNQALSKFNDALRGNIDLSVDLLQGGQTTRMVRSALDTLRYVKSFSPLKLKQHYADFQLALLNRKIRRRKQGDYANTNEIKEAARAVGGKWLEYQYGWRPMAQTLYDTTIELASALPPLLKVEGIGKIKSFETSQVPWFVDAGILDFRDQERSHRARIRAQYKFPAEATQLLGKFTSLNPANILWELTPYSFVVDWFLDVGGYLRNLESAMLYNSAFQSGYVTETVRTENWSHAFGSYKSGGTTVTKDYKGGTVFIAKRRTVLAFHPSPRLPRFEAKLGSGRLLNAAALMAQFLK